MEWISVRDLHPKSFEEVILSSKTKGVFNGYCLFDYDTSEFLFFSFSFSITGKIHDVTHWMKYPEIAEV